MKKITARVLIVCLLLLQILSLIACSSPLDDLPPDPDTSNGLLITPDSNSDSNDTPNTPPSSDTDTVVDEDTDTDVDADTDTDVDEDVDTDVDADTDTEIDDNEIEDLTPIPTGIKNIILIIGDGMGLQQIQAGQMVEGKNYSFTNWQNTVSNTDSVNTAGKVGATTDSAAGGTALATGVLTVNGYVGKDHTGKDLPTIMDTAKSLGKSTGIVTTDTLFGATPAAFSAHSISRQNTDEIVASQIASGVDLLCGTTDTACTSQKSSIEAAGYTYCASYPKIAQTLMANKVYWQFPLASSSAYAPRLADVSVHALNFLNRDEDGFVLMIEQAHIDKYAHNNDFANMAKSVKSLNDTVEAILNWLGDRDDTAIFITADHETGGLSVSLDNVYSHSYHVSTATDPYVVYYDFLSGSHTNQMVGVFVFGVTVDFSACEYYRSETKIKNTDIHHIMTDILNNPTKYIP